MNKHIGSNLDNFIKKEWADWGATNHQREISLLADEIIEELGIKRDVKVKTTLLATILFQRVRAFNKEYPRHE